MESIDLTPFGFTPTESTAYSALLAAGPSSGYALARALGIARANAYQALHGLVGKGAAVIADQEPLLFRSVQPAALLAQIAREQEHKLDVLERAVSSAHPVGAPARSEFTGQRELFAIALRTLTRDPGVVTCLASLALLSTLLPIWRKRAADGAATNLWVIGQVPEVFPIELNGSVAESVVVDLFGHSATIITAANCVSLAILEGDTLRGIWASDPIIMGAARAAVAALTT